jgi:pyruvate dehydrogenase E2 component (dihydrolipoamide acetyltransferase)
VGVAIATLETEAEDLLGGLLDTPAGTAGTAATTEKAAPEVEVPAEPAAEPPPASRPPVVPAARRRAGELDVDVTTIAGSGPNGLVRVADVEAAATTVPAPATGSAGAVDSRDPALAAPAVGDVEEVPLSSMRRVVARRLVESMQSTPHFYLTSTVDAEALLDFRAELNRQLAGRGEEVKVSVNDLIVKGCAVLLRANPALNVSFGGDKLLIHQRVHVGIAVAVDGGLVVPVVRDADRKSLTQVASEASALIGRARAGKLAGGDMSGGTFTVSNLGMYGIDQFTAVINPPEAAILAVGAAIPEPVATDDGVAVHRRMRLTLSIDHRALDGATGAQFLAQLKDLLEHPLRIVA